MIGQAQEPIHSLSLTVNGDPIVVDVPNDRRLVAVLREDLGLTGTKLACEVGVCGVCTVLVDGRPISSCITLAMQVEGQDVMTVEGLSDHPQFQRLQEAFVVEGGLQCGFCTSGQLMAAAALITGSGASTVSREEIARYMMGNLCRCTGYYGILRAIETTVL